MDILGKVGVCKFVIRTKVRLLGVKGWITCEDERQRTNPNCDDKKWKEFHIELNSTFVLKHKDSLLLAMSLFNMVGQHNPRH